MVVRCDRVGLKAVIRHRASSVRACRAETVLLLLKQRHKLTNRRCFVLVRGGGADNPSLPKTPNSHCLPLRFSERGMKLLLGSVRVRFRILHSFLLTHMITGSMCSVTSGASSPRCVIITEPSTLYLCAARCPVSNALHVKTTRTHEVYHRPSSDPVY